MKPEANRVGGEGPTGKPRPFDRALALFDPLLARAALVVEGDDILGAPRHVGDDEADARIKLARMPLDLGDDPTRLRPACGPVVEVGVIPANMVRWPPDRTLEQVADPVLQDAVRRKPDRVFDPFGFKIFVDIEIGEARDSVEIDARDLAAIARHTGANASLVQQFNESFSARLQAMAAAQDMLSRSSWQRADLGAAPQSLLNSLKIRA